MTSTNTADGLLRQIAFTRLRIVGQDASTSTTPATHTAILAELAHVGIRVTNPDTVTDALAPEVPHLVGLARSLRGEHARYSPLFPGFPDRLPAADDGRTRLLAGALRLLQCALDLGDGPEDGWAQLTDDDVRAAMDFTASGGWPASSVPQDVQRAELDRAVQELLPPDRHTEWLPVTLVTMSARDDRLRAWMADAFATPTSLRDDVRADLAALTAVLGVSFIDPATVRFRETAPLLHALLWDRSPDALGRAGLSPDDLLRLMAQLTGTDTTLRSPIRYPAFTRAQRRLIVGILEASPRLGDVFRRRGIWLGIARGLHLAEHDAPLVHGTFTRLRAGRHDPTSLASRVEAAYRAGDVASAVGMLAGQAPGAMIRQVRRLAAASTTSQAQDTLVDSVRTVAAPLRVLFAARAQVRDNGRTYPRAAFTPGGAVLDVPGPVGHLAVTEDLAARLMDAIDEAISSAAVAKGDLTGARAWVDPRLDDVLVPDGLRSTAPGLVQVERGSRLPLYGLGADVARPGVLRLFVHWRQADIRSDLDLSMMALDDRFNLVSQVSWTQLTSDGGAMIHSGDLISAPSGAEEFIDVRLDAARSQPQWRYLAPSVLRYSGPSFGQLPEAHVGWMLRRDATSDRATFDVSTVVNALALTGSAGTAVPFAVDLATEQILYVDVYRNSPWRARVERDGLGIARILSAISHRAAIKVSAGEVARTVLCARGAVTIPDRASAGDDVLTVGLDDTCTLNVLRPEKFLAGLL